MTALRLWDDRATPRPGVQNMAVDEFLLGEAARTGSPVLRIYRWDRPTLSLGYFMPEAEARTALRSGETMVRRWTGGGLVHHEGAVTWSLAVPVHEAFFQVRPAESYPRLHEALARCLTASGVDGIRVVQTIQSAPAGGICSEAPAPGDLLRHDRKIAGAGQRRTRRGLLHQGVIFLPEAELPGDFPGRLAVMLAGKTGPFCPPSMDSFDSSRYEDPAWLALR